MSIVRNWHFIALTFIATIVTALLVNATPLVATNALTRAAGIVAALALLLLVYVIARGLMSDVWALLPVIMLGFAPPFLTLGASSISHTAAALALLSGLWTFTRAIEQPSRQKLLIAGVMFGLTLLAHPLSFMLAGACIALAFAALTTSIAIDWKYTEPEMRRRRFLIRAIRYAQATLAVLFIGIVIVYIFYAIMGKTVSAEIGTPLIIAWLLDNAALRPLGAYVFNIAQYINGLPPASWNFPLAFTTSLPLPLLGLFAIALWSAINGLIKSGVTSIVVKTPLILNHIATNPVGLMLQLGTALFIAMGFRAINSDEAILLILPPLTILSASAIKRWFNITDEMLARNTLLRVLLFTQHIWSVSLKALALGTLIIMLVLTAVIFASKYALYTNSIGALLS